MNTRRRRGRPLTGTEPLDNRFTLLVSQTTKKHLDQMAGGASDFVRYAIESAMRRRGPARARAKARSKARRGRSSTSRQSKPKNRSAKRTVRGANRTSRRGRR